MIRHAAIGVPPSIRGLRRGIWLDFVVDVASNDERAIEALWHVDLTVGALADALAQTGQLGIAGATVDGHLPDNTTVPLSGGIGDVTAGQSFSDAGDQTIKADLTQALKQANLTPVSIDIVRVDQPAPAVVAEAADPRTAAAAVAQTTASLFGKDPPNYEGYYLEVRDTKGNPVFIRSAAFRSGVSAAWASPSVADVFPLSHR